MLTLTTLTLTESDTHIFDYSLFTGLQDWPRDFYRFLGSLTGFQDFFLQVPRISFYRFKDFYRFPGFSQVVHRSSGRA